MEMTIRVDPNLLDFLTKVESSYCPVVMLQEVTGGTTVEEEVMEEKEEVDEVSQKEGTGDA
jgi:hypothetical protein